MQQSDVIEFLKRSGWQCKRDEVGDQYCLLDQDDRQLQVIPTLREGKDPKTGEYYKTLAFLESVSTYNFINAANYILDEKNDHKPMIKPWQSEFRQRMPDFSLEDIESLVHRLIVWSKNQDIDVALREYQMECPDRPGQKQIYHVAALALAGNVNKLEYYQKSFASDDRLNFVPMVTSGIINRAVELAKNKEKK